MLNWYKASPFCPSGQFSRLDFPTLLLTEKSDSGKRRRRKILRCAQHCACAPLQSSDACDSATGPGGRSQQASSGPAAHVPIPTNASTFSSLWRRHVDAVPAGGIGSATGCRSSAIFNTSSIVSTKCSFMSFRMFSGMSGQILLVIPRQDRLENPVPVRGQQLLFQAADRQHPAAQRDLAGHRHIAAHRNARQRAEQMLVAIVIPADGPSFGIAPSGTCTWMSRWR